jgi:phosphatidylinositol-3-phosphatase
VLTNLNRVSRDALAAVALVLGVLAAPAALASGETGGPAGAPPIRHVFLIVLENKDYDEAYQLYASSDPYLSQTLPSMGADLPYYYSTGHDSLDNYIALISGQPPTADTKNDCDPDGSSNEVGTSADSYGVAQTGGCWYPANFHTVADQLVTAGYTWHAYEEDMSGNCSANGISGGSYAEKHNPFPYFASLLGDGQCAANDVPLYPAGASTQSTSGSNLATDLQSVASTPNFVFITPNECDDGHNDCIDPSSVSESPQQTEDQLAQDNAFLKKWVPVILDAPAYKQDGMLVITFDEGDVAPTALDSCCSEPSTDPDGTPPGGEGDDGYYSPGPGGGQVGAVVLSRYIAPGTVSDVCYNHYSFLHTVEDLFGLPYLAEAAEDKSGVPGGVNSFGGDVYTDPNGAAGAAPPAGATGSSLPASATGAGCATAPGSYGTTGPTGPATPGGSGKGGSGGKGKGKAKQAATPRLRIGRCRAVYKRTRRGSRRLVASECAATLAASAKTTINGSAALSRGRLTYATGTARGHRLALRVRRKLKNGKYVLRIRRARRVQRITVEIG